MELVTYLMALVAFAAVLAVYATVVTVLVEGVHRLFGLRSAGLSEMLRAFYDKSLAALQPVDTEPTAQAPVGADGPRASPQSRDFAKRMAARSPSESLKPWYLRRLPIIGSLFTSTQQRLTTLQFVERLAHTPEGAALAGHGRGKLPKALTAAAYEFERLGEAQSVYFRARSKFISVLTGIAVALFVNLDAIAMYKELVRNNEISAKLTLLAETNQLELLAGFNAPNAVAGVGDGQLAAEARDAVGQVARMATDFETMGLPIGRTMYPYCRGYVANRASETAAPLRSPESTAPGQLSVDNGSFRDQRCQILQDHTFGAFLKTNGLDQEELGTWGTVERWTQYRWGRLGDQLARPVPFISWIIGILIGGALLGLGAPFWFNLFARAASVAAPAARATLARGVPEQSAAQAQNPVRRGVRDTEASAPEDLERGFLISLKGAGQLLMDDPPPGQEWGQRPPTTRR